MRKNVCTWISCGLAGAMLASVALATTPALIPALKIGDPAPRLEVMTWIKGKPVTQFEPGQAYVVEFWATWCVPCIKMMPYLSELQQKYAGRLTVIGVNTRETDNTDGSVELVKAFVAKKADKMAYTVAMDDPVKKSVFDAWMTAAGSYGIPTTFVIDRAGKLVWVGQPIEDKTEFNKAIVQALRGKNDLAAARATQAQLNQDTAARLKELKLLRPMLDAQKKRDYPAIVAEADKVVKQAPQYEADVFAAKLSALLHMNESEALAFANRRAKDKAFYRDLYVEDEDRYWGMVGGTIATEFGFSKKMYQLALGYLQKALARNPDDTSTLVPLAAAYARLEKRDQAIAVQEKAIAIALKKGRREEYVEQLRSTLAGYRSGAR